MHLVSGAFTGFLRFDFIVSQGGVFHRNAGHVLQAQTRHSQPGLAFQEYSPTFPHKRLTLGYAGLSSISISLFLSLSSLSLDILQKVFIHCLLHCLQI